MSLGLTKIYRQMDNHQKEKILHKKQTLRKFRGLTSLLAHGDVNQG